MIFLDTSMLVAALIESHRHHGPSIKTFREVVARKIKAGISQHTLAELYSALTNYPSQPKLTPETAEYLILEGVLPYCRVVSLGPKDYRAAILRLKQRQFRGGVIYDALILETAIKCKAKTLYTWNIDDFSRLIDSKDILEIKQPSH